MRGLRRSAPRQPARPRTEPGDWAPGEDESDAAAGLDAIPSDERESLGHFPADYEAELAAGLLRSQGIAAEIAPPPIWGGPRSPEIWVHRNDAAHARQILADLTAVESPAKSGEPPRRTQH